MLSPEELRNIKNLVASNEVESAAHLVMGALEAERQNSKINHWNNEIIQLLGRWKETTDAQNVGSLDFKTADTQKSQIRGGLLAIIDDIKNNQPHATPTPVASTNPKSPEPSDDTRSSNSKILFWVIGGVILLVLIFLLSKPSPDRPDNIRRDMHLDPDALKNFPDSAR